MIYKTSGTCGITLDYLRNAKILKLQNISISLLLIFMISNGGCVRHILSLYFKKANFFSGIYKLKIAKFNRISKSEANRNDWMIPMFEQKSS
ncbi:hypothetical protein A8C56_10290 [Niabella ginsenosidivorans]|uniref:Uncharacterized protein n=1 Tax=Niabella ginsenosidivorans TaxID=1176587 RepID=A0A1A9I3M4_9BACT|nr:hypothetical protein A8C56_10290 [Niabella ginsenosidivorans]